MEIQDFERGLLKDEAKFIETYSRTPDDKFITFDIWQRGYTRDRSTRKVVKKSRRAGFTFADSAQGVYRSQNVIRDWAPYVYEKHFISRSLNESREKITVANWIWDCLPTQRKLKIVSKTKSELIFEDSRGRLTRLKAHTSNDPRGIGGDISFDEAAFIKNFKSLYAAGQLVTGRGGDLVVGSSPAGASGLFYDIFENKDRLYTNYKRWNVPWWLSRALCTDVLRASIEAPKVTTEERVARFGTQALKDIFATMLLQDFQQECETFYADESATYFPYELLRPCEESLFGADYKDAEVKFAFDHMSTEPTESFWRWIRDHKRGTYEVGYDVGRHRDLAALVVVDTIDDRREVRAVLTLNRAEFDTQEKVLDDCIKIIRPVAVRFDATGIGERTGEMMVKRHGSMFECIKFTPPWKKQAVVGFKMLLEKRLIKMPSWAPLIDNIHSIRKEVNSKTLNVSFESDSTEHHGDIAWALMLAVTGSHGKLVAPEYGGSRIISRESAPI